MKKFDYVDLNPFDPKSDPEMDNEWDEVEDKNDREGYHEDNGRWHQNGVSMRGRKCINCIKDDCSYCNGR